MAEAAKQPDPATQRLITMLSLVCAAPAIYCAWSYSGPYRWLAELQLRWFGVYEKTITFLLTLFSILLPLLATAWLARKLGFAKPPQAEESGGRWLQTGSNLFGDLVVIGVGLFFVGMGALQYYRGTRESQVTKFEVSEMEAGKKFDRLWVEVSGRPLFDQASVIGSNHKEEFYVPIVSENWKPGQPISVYLEVQERELSEDLKKPQGQYQGMVTVSGLPGMAREDFKRRHLAPAEGYVMVDYGRTPALERKFGRDMALIGGGFCLFGIGLAAYQKFRTGRIGPAQSPPLVAQLQIKSIVPLDTRRTDQAG